MSYRDVYIAEQTMDQSVAERLHQAETRRLVRQLTPSRQNGLSREGRWLVCKLGYLLVTLGAWLERFGQPASCRAEGETG